ncbi:hypothetical protein RHCH11_RHCH11_00785 [Beijerinckiaceae bacterium RH CH11]|nr:hypothetical protein RHAL8_00783 [Beijerinckiaceae bacterium RH AL8]VVB43621.1 hypothetical protein RHCH11_RHCH11_00785 [Beijerinckiaceae bacterium RH CH11]
MTPTVVPAAAPSATLFGAALLSVGVDGAMSPTAIEKVCALVSVPSLAWTVTL